MISVGFSSDIFERQRHGGISRYFIELAENISVLGDIEIKISTLVHINSTLKNSSFNSGLYLPFSPSRMKLGSLIRYFNNKRAKEFSTYSPLDIRHETFYGGGIDQIVAKKTVTTIYDLIREKFSQEWQGSMRKQDSISRADAVICISQTTANDLQEHYQVDPSKITIIPLGVSEFFLKTDLQSVKKQQLLYVGSRDGYKDFKTLVVAFSNSKYLRSSLRVLVFGTRFTKEENCLMQSLGVRNCFHQVTGNDELLLSAYHESIALVITSKYEGFGLPVLEAMMAGCVVITSRGGSLKEVSGGFDIPFEYSNSDSLTEAINISMNSTLLDKKHIENARNHARSFSWESLAKRTAILYKTILEKS